MKYSAGHVAKAIVALVVTTIATAAGLAHGADLSVLDLGQWLSAAGAGLTAAGGVFAVPNKTAPGTGTTKVPADAAITAIQQTLTTATQATSDLERVKQAATQAFTSAPIVGPLAQQAINLLPRL